MDLDLWQSSASIGNGSDAEYGCEFDYGFYYVPDIIEENAINEKSCVEVLNRLIAKADVEIFDLEDDLAILQSQLSWVVHDEHEKSYEVLCAAFREKISSLSRSLQTLRKGYGTNAYSGIHYKSIERIHEIISALFKHNFSTENKKILSLSRSLQTLRKGYGRNAYSGIHHKPIERMLDIISALFKHNFSTENKKELIKLRADIEVREKTSAVSASVGSSRKQDNQQNIGTDNQVSYNEIKGAKVVKEASKAVILFQQDCEGKDKVESTLAAPLWPSDVKVEFDENEPLATFLSSQGSKRRKNLSNPARYSRTADEEKKTRKNLCKNDIIAATSRSKSLNASEGRSSGTEEPPLHASASSSGSTFGLASEANREGGTNYSSSEKQAEETAAASRYTREELGKMKRDELMAVAKSHGLKGYGKLKKSLVVDLIVGKLG